MSWKEQIQEVRESLKILTEEGFLYDMESLQMIHQAILSFIPRWVRDNPWLWQVQDILDWPDFLEILENLRASLSQLRPAVICLRLATLQSCLQELEQDPEAADSLEEAPEDIISTLKELAPGQVLNNLHHMTKVVQECRPPGGFQPLATHPSVVAHLGNSNFFKFLVNLEEVVDDDLLDQEITHQLLFLQDFVQLHASPPEPRG